jgi:endonuclease/exonuclease/phosphatase family metal-dependent hydrolase
MKTPVRETTKRIVAFSGLVVFAGLTLACARPDRRAAPKVVQLLPGREMVTSPDKTSLRLMTLNVAHGRGSGPHQLLQRTSAHKANLNNISIVIRRESPDVVALQEADGPSYWSGKFNHVEYLAKTSGYSYYLQCEHARRMGLSYGNALISALPVRDPFGAAFERSFITAPKGFLVSTIEWPGNPRFEFDVVSVHFAAFSRLIRKKQIDEFIGTISDRDRPVIVMGDLNCEWIDSTKTLASLAEALDLRAFRPNAIDIKTYRRFDRRVDWILVSSEFRFVSHQVLPDSVSDHQAVVAQISLARED